MPLLQVTNLTNKPAVVSFLVIPPYGTLKKFVTIETLEKLAGRLIAAQESGLIRYDTGDFTPLPNKLEGATLDETGGGGTGKISVYDEGVLVQADVDELDFRGADVLATPGGGSRAVIYIPPPAYLSHWNTADGSNGDQSVSESISRTVAHISTPHGGEGVPFRTGGWAGTDQQASLDGVATFTTPANLTISSLEALGCFCITRAAKFDICKQWTL